MPFCTSATSSAVLAVATLCAVLYLMALAVGPGSPGERLIVGELELLRPGEEP